MHWKNLQRGNSRLAGLIRFHSRSRRYSWRSIRTELKLSRCKLHFLKKKVSYNKASKEYKEEHKGKPPKKAFIFLMAVPLREGGKGLAIKKKIIFFFLLFCHLKVKIFYFRKLIDIWTIDISRKSLSVVIFTGLLQCFPKIGLFKSENWGKKKKLPKSLLSILCLRNKKKSYCH